MQSKINMDCADLKERWSPLRARTAIYFHEANNNKATTLCGPFRPWKTDLICCINLADSSWFQQDQQYFSTFNLLEMLYRSSNSLSGFNISVTASIWIWFSCFFLSNTYLTMSDLCFATLTHS